MALDDALFKRLAETPGIRALNPTAAIAINDAPAMDVPVTRGFDTAWLGLLIGAEPDADSVPNTSRWTSRSVGRAPRSVWRSSS